MISHFSLFQQVSVVFCSLSTFKATPFEVFQLNLYKVNFVGGTKFHWKFYDITDSYWDYCWDCFFVFNTFSFTLFSLCTFGMKFFMYNEHWGGEDAMWWIIWDCIREEWVFSFHFDPDLMCLFHLCTLQTTKIIEPIDFPLVRFFSRGRWCEK